MKINRSIIIIFIIVIVAVAGLITLALRLTNQQNARAISARRTEEAALTQTRLAEPSPTRVISETQTGLPTPEPPLPTTSPTNGLTQVPTAETEPSTTNTQSAQTGETDTDPQPTNTEAELTELPTSTPEPTQPPTPTQDDIFTPVDWTGGWTAFFGDEGGLLFRANLTISREGNTITGTHSTQVFTGTLSEDGLSVIGTWVNPPSSGDFGWYIVGENQFCGNTEGDFAYCAARSGASRPDPCFCNRPVE